MKKALILVEGQTEETFVREILDPFLNEKGIFIIPSLVVTKRVKSGSNFKGGIVSYDKVKNDLLKLLKDSSAAIVTTMIDFYGLPNDFPGKATLPTGNCYQKVEYLEGEFSKNISNPKFLPYFSIHELEALVFVEPAQIARAFPNSTKLSDLEKIKAAFNSPEEINDNPQTAPSKRLLTAFPEYQKALYTPLILLDIALDKIRQECPHFNAWVSSIEKIVAN